MGDADDAGDAQKDPAETSAANEPRGYWADRLGQQPRRDVWPPAPGTPSPAPTSGPYVAPPAVGPRGPYAGPQPNYDSGYRRPNTRRNWLIGTVAAIVVAAVVFVTVFSVNSGVKNILSSIGALPSSGSNTIAWYWGGNPFADSNSTRPVNIGTDDQFTTIRVSTQGGDDAAYFVALNKLGTAYLWGTPNGPNASLAVTLQPTPVVMPTGVRFTSISTNDGYVLALDQSGRLWNWGNLSLEKTGAATATIAQSPVELATPAGVTFTSISAGWSFSLALDSTGHAWSWGNDESDDLGLATNTTPVPTPTPVTMPPGVTFTEVAAGYATSVALDTNGRAWAWGDNTEGELGVNEAAVTPATPGPCEQGDECSATPVAVNIPANVRLTTIAAGEFYETAVDSTGRIWSWGTNAYGALGLAGHATTCATTTACTPIGPPQATNSVPAVVPPPSGTRFVAVAVTQGPQQGEDATIALDSHGVAWGWGTDLILQFPSGAQACFTEDNQSQSVHPGVGLCVLQPRQLDMPSGVSFKSITASTDTLIGFPR